MVDWEAELKNTTEPEKIDWTSELSDYKEKEGFTVPEESRVENAGPSSFQQMLRSGSNAAKIWPMLEAAANMTSSYYGTPISGLAGLVALPFGLDNAKRAVEMAQKLLIYEPKSKEGEEFLQDLTYPFQLYAEGVHRVGKTVEDLGYPNAAATLETLGLSIPAVSGMRGLKAQFKPRVPISQELSSAIRKRVNKLKITPTKKGVTATRPMMENFYKDVEGGIVAIAENKNNLKLLDKNDNWVTRAPETLNEFSQAIEQTKLPLAQEFSSLAESLGDNYKINLNRLGKELDTIIKDKVLQTELPDVVNYALEKKMAYNQNKAYTASEAQQAIQIINARKKGSPTDPAHIRAGKAMVDDLILNNMRNDLNNLVEKVTGKEYGSIKKKYGQLKSFEEYVHKEAVKESKKSGISLIDYSDIYTGGEVVKGLISLATGKGAAPLAKGVVGKTIAATYSYLNKPSRHVKGLFKDVDKFIKEPGPIKGATQNIKKAMPASKVAATNSIAYFQNKIDNNEFNDAQKKAFEELKRRGFFKSEYPALRRQVQKEVGVGETLKDYEE